MNNKEYSFARNFFSRPENDDTIEQFKKEYMTSMKNYQLATEGKNRDIQSPARSHINETNNYLINGSVKKTKNNNNNNNNSNSNSNNISSRLSSTATLSSDDHQELLILKNEVKSLLDSRDKDSFDKINLKALLNNFDSRLNNLESLILKSRNNNNNNSNNNNSNNNSKFDQPSLSLPSYRPISSYDSIPQSKNYWNKDESYDYMLMDQLRKSGNKYNSINYVNKEDNHFRDFYSHRSDPIVYSPTPQRKYNYNHNYGYDYDYDHDHAHSNYSRLNNSINNSSGSRPKYQRNSSLYRNNININSSNKNNRNENDMTYDDISTIDILNRKI